MDYTINISKAQALALKSVLAGAILTLVATKCEQPEISAAEGINEGIEVCEFILDEMAHEL